MEASRANFKRKMNIKRLEILFGSWQGDLEMFTPTQVLIPASRHNYLIKFLEMRVLLQVT